MLINTIYVGLIFPYLHKLDNIRCIINKVLLLLIVSIQIFSKIHSENLPEAFKGIYPWIVSCILILGAIMNGSYIIYRTILWLKKPGIINMKMYV